MAVRTVTRLTDSWPHTGFVVSWVGLLDEEAGDEVSLVGYSDRSVQVNGTFGAEGSVSLEGSNDGTNFVILDDPQGNALTFTSAGLLPVGPLTRYVRPRVTAGDETTDLDVYVLVSGVREGG